MSLSHSPLHFGQQHFSLGANSAVRAAAVHSHSTFVPRSATDLLDQCRLHINKTEQMRRNGFLWTVHSQASSKRQGQLYCRTGYHLQVLGNGRIHGTSSHRDRFTALEFLSVAFGLVSIRGCETGRYLCMNRKGRLYGSRRYSNECVFMEQLTDVYYNTYRSCKFADRRKRFYVAIGRKGRTKRGNRAYQRKKHSQFLVLHHKDYHHPYRGAHARPLDPKLQASWFERKARSYQVYLWPTPPPLSPRGTIIDTRWLMQNHSSHSIYFTDSRLVDYHRFTQRSFRHHRHRLPTTR